MDVGELLYSIKTGSISDLLPCSRVVTLSDRRKYNSLGYTTGLYKNLVNYIGKEIAEHLYYQKIYLGGLVYYDKSKSILIDSNMYLTDEGFSLLIGKEKLQSYIDFVISKSIKERVTFVPEAYKLEYFLSNIKNMGSDIYSEFIENYISIDFGFDKLSKSDIEFIFNSKTKEEKSITANKLKNFSDIIPVYRGLGSKSLDEGYSYTLDFDVARFFAYRFSNKDDSVRIMEGYVKKSDVIEYIDDRGEAEIIALPSDIFNKRVYTYHSFDKFSVNIKEYNYYANMLKLNFDIESSYHGINHMLRVLVLTMLIAEHYNIEKEFRPTLYTAAVLHDVGRTNDDEDESHGLLSYEKVKGLVGNNGIDLELLQFLMSNHCVDDDKIKYKNSNYKKLLFILKDADALDRQRFGIKELNSDYLRYKFSKKLSFYAFKLLKVHM